jgi:RNA recognition motif-containing protein
MNIFVAKLSSTTTSEDLKELFEEYGEVISAKVIQDRETGQSKGFGFVEMKNDNEAMNAINELDECEFDSSQIAVKKARPKTDDGGSRQNRSSYGNRRY